MQAIQRKIVRMGASCGLTLPTQVCETLGIKLGSNVTLTKTRNGLLVRPVPRTQMSLAERIATSSVDAVRAAGRSLAELPVAGRERP